VNARLVRAALLAARALAPRAARAESWGAAEVAEAERLRAEEAAHAKDYRERVARGDVRGAAAPMPREAPQTPETSPGDALRGAADIIDSIQRWFEEAERQSRRERGSR
jgi:hypothetical protein